MLWLTAMDGTLASGAKMSTYRWSMGGPSVGPADDGREAGRPDSVRHDRPDALLERQLFEQLPYPLLVLSRTGRVLTANGAAREMLELESDAPVQCCELLGCRNVPGILEKACITEILAAAGPGQSPIRIHWPGHRRGGRASLTLVPLVQDRSHIVLQLAEDKAPDAEGATVGRPEPHVRLRITTLGRTQIQANDRPVDARWLEQRAGEVLQYLVCERHRWVLTDEIAEAIWPNAASSSVENVRFVIYDLRRRLEPERPHRGRSAFISSGKGRYQLDPNHVIVDADEFQQAVSDGIEAFYAGRHQASAKLLDRALELYQGDFLDDARYAAWAALERTRLHGLATRALRLRGELSRRAGDVNDLHDQLERLAQMEPFEMDVQRQLLTVCLQLNRYGEASRRYGDLSRRMLVEFGERPSFELSDLVRQQHQLALV